MAAAALEQTAEPGWFDAAYEFDAPKHHDFESMSPNNSRASAWFERQDLGGQAPVKSPLQDIQNSLLAPVQKSLKKNIVTSWGGAPSSTKKQVLQHAKPAGPSGVSQPAAKEAAAPPAQPAKGRNKLQPREGDVGPSTSAAAPPPAASARPAASTATANPMAHARNATAAVLPRRKSSVSQAAAPRPAASAVPPRRPTATAVRSRPAATEVPLRVTRSASKKMQDSTRRKLRSSDANSGAGRLRSCVLQGGVQKKAPVRSKRPSSYSGVGGSSCSMLAGPPAGAAAARLKKALQPRPRVAPVRSTKALTLPDDVDLKIDHRARAADLEQPAGTPFKPLAVKVLEFQRKTPARFRSRPAPRPEHPPLSITEAKEPSLKTSGRARPTQAKPRDQQELEEMEALPKFHARPLNPQLLSNTDPLPHIERKALTEPQPFVFVTDDRAEARQRHGQGHAADDEAGPFVFKAAPLNRHILEAPEALPAHKQFESTVPQSPMLMTKKLRPRKSQAYQLEEAEPVFHARPVPDFIQLPREFSRHRPAPAATHQQPFHLATDDRGRKHAEEEAARLAADKEAARAAAAAASARAGLLPLSLDIPNIPHRPKCKPATTTQPFKLESEVRHAEFVDDFARERQQEESAKRAEANFKARPVPHVVPMMPHPSDQPLTVPDDVHLPTEHRAVKRQRFDESVEERMRTQEEERLRAEEAARLAEEYATRRHRETLKFEARPLPMFQRPFMALPSSKPLTAPHEPKLGKSKRQRGEAAAPPAPPTVEEGGREEGTRKRLRGR